MANNFEDIISNTNDPSEIAQLFIKYRFSNLRPDSANERYKSTYAEVLSDLFFVCFEYIDQGKELTEDVLFKKAEKIIKKRIGTPTNSEDSEKIILEKPQNQVNNDDSESDDPLSSIEGREIIYQSLEKYKDFLPHNEYHTLMNKIDRAHELPDNLKIFSNKALQILYRRATIRIKCLKL